MSQGRTAVIEELLTTIDGMLDTIEDREPIEPDFAVVREYAEQLRDEVESLQDM